VQRFQGASNEQHVPELDLRGLARDRVADVIPSPSFYPSPSTLSQQACDRRDRCPFAVCAKGVLYRSRAKSNSIKIRNVLRIGLGKKICVMPLVPTEGNGGGFSTLLFVAGIAQRMANVLSAPTLLISVPTAEMLFVDIATLYDGWCSGDWHCLAGVRLPESKKRYARHCMRP
jgi:hypothetical protein